LINGSETLDDTSRSETSAIEDRGSYAVANAINRLINENEDNERDEYGNPIFTIGYIKKMCKSNGNLYYHTHELNDILYLNCKGFRELRNFD